MKIIFACAGSGGHINPAIAIANDLIKRDVDTKVLFIGRNNEMENDLVKKHGFNQKNIRTSRIVRKLTFKNLESLWTNVKGIGDAKKIIKKFKPDLIIGTGGFVCVPVMLAAKSLKVKYMLHESNAFPGLAIKILAKNAACVMIGFEEARKKITEKCPKIIYTGTPIKFSKASFDRLDKRECRQELDIPLTKKVVLVTGGSQGAQIFSTLLTEIFSKHKEDKELNDSYYVLISGNSNYDMVKDLLKEKGLENCKNLKVLPFVYDMEKMYKASDIALTRSGALTITELVTTSLPAVLIPLPYAAENHQLFNANVLASVDGAEIIEEKDLTAEKLYAVINSIILDNNKLQLMKDGISEKYVDGVDDRIYGAIKTTIGK
ncbi:MAG: undecaprenyldiphospho-muramoylpentapeptide beta-N-acetylglucosaminyltransferase [Clostridia bacterium]